VLYWTVMNLLTALQQWLLLHEDRNSSATPGEVTAKAAVVESEGRRRGARR